MKIMQKGNQLMTKVFRFTAFSFLLGFTATLQAQVEKIILRVDGLACPFCAYGLEKKLKKLDGALKWDIRINEGKAILLWKSDKELKLEAIQKAVGKAGFTLRGITGSFTGVVQRENGKFILITPPPARQRFSLHESTETVQHSHDEEGSDKALTKGMRKRLQEFVESQKPVMVEGAVHGHKDPAKPRGLQVASLKKATKL